jgi:hypothetical protein
MIFSALISIYEHWHWKYQMIQRSIFEPQPAGESFDFCLSLERSFFERVNHANMQK